MRVAGVGDYKLLGETLDDAAGEAFDKSAKLLGLGYPGGPALAKLATPGQPGRYRLPRPMLASGDLDFSFSGLKTAVLTVDARARRSTEAERADLAAEIEAAIVDVLVAKALAALERTGLDATRRRRRRRRQPRAARAARRGRAPARASRCSTRSSSSAPTTAR